MRPFPPTSSRDPLDGAQVLKVGLFDFAVASITCAASFYVFWLAMTAKVPVWEVLVLHLAVLCIPACYVAVSRGDGEDLTMPALLLMGTFAGGPIGAAGCAFAALALWWHRPAPLRLLDWYDYIAGIVKRSRLSGIYDELASGRLPPDLAVGVPRFVPILAGSSIEEQQRVLGILGRHYNSDFRQVMRLALRSRNGLIRTQAAAIVSRFDLAEKSYLWLGDADKLEKNRPPSL